MEKTIVSCLAVITLALFVGCASDRIHSTTIISQDTLHHSPTTTMATDTQSK